MISDTYKNETNLKKVLNKFPHHPIKTTETKCPFLVHPHLDEPTQQHIDLVRTSWERVSEIRHEDDDRNVSSCHAFGLAFYDALFEMNIECKHAFTNTFQQARALTGMIAFLTRAPHITGNSSPSSPTTIRDINAKKRDNNKYDECDPELLALQMRELGAKHVSYHVQPHHFDLVGPAFVKALRKRLGNEYTDDIGEAWMKANAYIAYNMKIGYEFQQTWHEDTTNDRSSKKHKSSCTIQ